MPEHPEIPAAAVEAERLRGAIEDHREQTLSIEAALPHLRRPFTVDAVKWKVQATWGTGGLIVPYIDARLVIERLNHVTPYWTDEYEPIAGGKGLLCRLTVEGITRLDVGSGYEGKGLYSDAFKRAAVKFGIGVSLYALPKIMFNVSDGFLEEKTRGKKKVLELTKDGEKRLREGYTKWLEKTGEPKFGPVLDHGDVAGSIGDPEAEAAPPETADPDPDPQPAKLETESAKALIAGAEKVYNEFSKEAKGRLRNPVFRRQLEGAWHDEGELKALIEKLEKRRDA